MSRPPSHLHSLVSIGHCRTVLCVRWKRHCSLHHASRKRSSFFRAQPASMLQPQVSPFPGKLSQHFPPHFAKISPFPTCVSGGWLYDCVPRLQDPSLLSILYHPQADAVLYTAPSIEELTFCHWKQRNQAEFLNSSNLLNRLFMPKISARATMLTCLSNMSPPCFTPPEMGIQFTASPLLWVTTTWQVWYLMPAPEAKPLIFCQSSQNMTSPLNFTLYYSQVN